MVVPHVSCSEHESCGYPYDEGVNEFSDHFFAGGRWVFSRQYFSVSIPIYSIPAAPIMMRMVATLRNILMLFPVVATVLFLMRYVWLVL